MEERYPQRCRRGKWKHSQDAESVGQKWVQRSNGRNSWGRKWVHFAGSSECQTEVHGIPQRALRRP